MCHGVCGGQRPARGGCFLPSTTWDPSQPSGLASGVPPFETPCEPLPPLFAGSLVHISCPPKLPTLPANTCRCVGFFNQHLNGHFLLPIAHHRGRCWRSSLYHVYPGMPLQVTHQSLCVYLCPPFQAPGGRWWWLWSHAPASMEQAHTSHPAFSFQLLLPPGCLSESRSLPTLTLHGFPFALTSTTQAHSVP